MTDDFAPKSRRNHFAMKLYLIFTGITLTQLLKTLSKIRSLLLKGARKIAPEEMSGSGFGLGLALELGLGAILLGCNFPRTLLKLLNQTIEL